MAAIAATVQAVSREYWILWIIDCGHALAFGGTATSNASRYARVGWIAALAIFPSFRCRAATSQSAYEKLPRAVQALPYTVASGTPLGEVQRLSRDADRRHFSPSGILFPNWSGALGIMDQRILGALYPKSFHGLNGGTGLSLRWNRDPNHRLYPDRFFGPLGPEMMMEDDFRRIMAVNRVSLFSFHRGENYFSKNVAIGPYAPSACRLLASSATIDSYLCPGMGGVGYFPNAVAVGKDQ